MKILVIGSGGREHAIIWKIRNDNPSVTIYCAPGNAGIEQMAVCIEIPVTDISSLKKFALENKIDLTVVGPEIPLALGIVDEFQSAGLRIFGPTRLAAEIESSKVFAKRLMQKYHIPSANYESFTTPAEAYQALNRFQTPYVIKADGLAAGKGVAICSTKNEAENFIRQVLDGKIFQEAGSQIIIEEFLEGFELSLFAITDGENFKLFSPAQDHKRALDDDKGKNTGGMGAYAPTPMVDIDFIDRISAEIIRPTIRAMKMEGRKFTGLLYCGLMITPAGPKVLEFNCRFGDPESQVILPILKSNLLDLLNASVDGQMDKVVLESNPFWSVCVILASGGYPDHYEKGKKIKGLDKITKPDVLVFHAGTKSTKDGLVTDGGRVLGITGIGNNIRMAKQKAYDAIHVIEFDKMHYRTDIADRAIHGLKIQE